jgi:RNA polymerase sigma factor (sigma-70 family)
MDSLAVYVDKQSEDFTAIIQPHLSAMVVKARKILGCENLAWDAVQEALLSLWREKELPKNLRAWLLRTVSHRSLHLLRCCSRCRKHEARAAHLRPEGCVCSDPSRIAENCELCDALEKAVNSLPRENRDVFILREFEGMDYQQVATLLDVPLGTIRSRLNRARAAVKMLLAREDLGSCRRQR